MGANLGHVFGSVEKEGQLQVIGLTNTPPPSVNVSEETMAATSLGDINEQLGTVQGGALTLGNAAGKRLELIGDDESGLIAAYDEAGKQTLNIDENGLTLLRDSVTAGTLQTYGAGTSELSMGTLAEPYLDAISFGTNSTWQRVAQQFQAVEDMSMCFISALIHRHHYRPAHTVYVRLRADASNSPGDILDESTIFVQNTYDTYYEVKLVAELTNGVKYWVEFDSSAYLWNLYPLYIYGQDDSDAYPAGLCKRYNGTWVTLSNTDVGLEIYKLASAPTLLVDQDFMVGGTLLGPTRKMILPLLHGGATDGGGVGSFIDYTQRNSEIAVGSGGLGILGAEYYWAPTDWLGQNFAFFFEACIRSPGGADASVMLWDEANSANLAVFTTASTGWAVYSSSEMIMPEVNSSLRLGMRISDDAYWCQVGAAYIMAYCGSSGW